MKIATFNIDWAKKSKDVKILIEEYLNNQNFDFLILTEAIKLNLSNYDNEYSSAHIPENVVYEELNYTQYLKGKKAFRTIIYSKRVPAKLYMVSDDKTSLAVEYETEFGQIIFYCTIIGTWYNRKPYALKELKNCIKDCKELYKRNPNLIIVGDLNTSFLENEQELTINENTTKSLKKLFSDLNLINTTEKIKENIDHIIIPKSFENTLIKSEEFVPKDKFSDHKGVFIELDERFL